MIHLQGDGWWEVRKPGMRSWGARLSFEQDAEKAPAYRQAGICGVALRMNWDVKD
jgi:hypothetical protein